MINLQFKDMIRRYGILIGFIGLITAFSILSERFFTISNMLIVMRQTSIVAFLAVGMSFVILGAGIDLSVGSVLAFSGAVGAGVMQNGGIFFGILAGLALGTVLGAEIMNRLAKAMNPSHLSRGFHTTGTLGPFGAVAAAGKIYGLSEEKFTRALGLAGLQSAGLLEISIGIIPISPTESPSHCFFESRSLNKK